MTDLLPCPFCGSEAVFEHRIELEYSLDKVWKFHTYSVFCTSPTCIAKISEISFERDEFDTREKDVIEKWNRRTNNE